MENVNLRRAAGLPREGIESLHHNWGWFLALGIALVVLGAIAIATSVIATLVSVALIGWLLAIGGAILVIQSFWTRRWSGFFLYLLGGLLYVVLGVLMIAHPAASAITLTLLLAAIFIVGGLFRIITAASERFPHWGWLLLNGIVSLILGIFIWMQWPVSGLWVIGTFVGIDMIISGWSFIMLATAARRLPLAHVAA